MPTHRSSVDANGGQTYIYLGGFFPAGTYPRAFEYLFDFAGSNGNTTGYIRPLLFERVPGELYSSYVVAGIGEGFQAAMNPLPQTIPFDIVEGIKVTPSGEFTFGFVFALVNASGEQLAASSGVMDMDLTPDSGTGVGGPKTTNFGEEGAPRDYHFLTCCGPVRTYSAQAIGAVPEELSLALVGRAILPAAGFQPARAA